jgi:hypothetical protein
MRSRGSSVSVVSDYGLGDRVSIPGRGKDFSSDLCVQTGSKAYPASCTMGTGGLFPGAKRGRGVTMTTHPHLVPRSKWVEAILPLPTSVTMACSGTVLLTINALVLGTLQWHHSLLWRMNSLASFLLRELLSVRFTDTAAGLYTGVCS